MRLDEREWKDFKIEEIFNIFSGKRLEKRNMISGDRPFIGASDSNNGVTGFCGNSNESVDHNVLGINYNGSVCEAFYHSYECIFSDDVKRLHLKHHSDNKYVLLFMSTVVRKQKSKYQYAYKFNEQRMKRQSIMLPVADNGEPDYQFMEHYIHELMECKCKKYVQYAEKQVEELGNVNKWGGVTYLLNNCVWNSFYVVAVFSENERGKRLKKADHRPGNVPYVSSTGENNGIDGFIEASEGTRVFNNCISIANSGSVGSAFYEPFSFVASDHVTHLKHLGLNKWQYLFLACVLKEQANNFNFNREINDARLNKMQIMLPITDMGEPDYTLMETVGKMIMSEKYRCYLSYMNLHLGVHKRV